MFPTRQQLLPLSVAALFSLAACDGLFPIDFSSQQEEGLTPAEIERADATESVEYNVDMIELPNGKLLGEYSAARGHGVSRRGLRAAGTNDVTPPAAVTGPQQKKADLIALMLKEAGRLADRSKWQVAAGEGDNEPKQDGLAYVYGSKSPDARTKATEGPCKQKLKGLDCSGMVFQIAQAADIPIPAGGASTQGKASTWEDAMPTSWNLKVKEVPSGEALESGDIVSWGHHIGIAGKEGGVMKIFQSNGGYSESYCEKNYGPNRGPRAVKWTSIKKWFKDDDGDVIKPTVLRIVVVLSGEFDFHLRCEGQTRDASTFKLEINNDDGGPFSAMGTGTDYNGTPLSITLSGSYDQAKNVLSGDLVPTPNRKDRFEVKLNEDDSGYFTLSKVKDNGGCTVQGRLVRIPLTSE